MPLDPDVAARNQSLQRQYYGEPVGVTVRRITAALGLNQGDLAALLGLSPPMLSQLASGQRAKIANPEILARLQQLTELAADPILGSISRDRLAARLRAIGESTARATITTGNQDDDDARVARALRAVATSAQLQAAAALLDGDHPQLARLLRRAIS